MTDILIYRICEDDTLITSRIISASEMLLVVLSLYKYEDIKLETAISIIEKNNLDLERFNKLLLLC